MSRWMSVLVLLSAVCSCRTKIEGPASAQAPAVAGVQVAAQSAELRQRPVVDLAPTVPAAAKT
jgi:hypothetical protein